jgi:hypothetical protein
MIITTLNNNKPQRGNDTQKKQRKPTIALDDIMKLLGNILIKTVNAGFINRCTKM